MMQFRRKAFRKGKTPHLSDKMHDISDDEDEPLSEMEMKEKKEKITYSNIYVTKLKKSKYKIVNDTDDINSIIALLKEWNISTPKLIVSVTGGAGQFSLPSRIKTAFKYGIAKIAESTDALIITGGTQTGVMKLVGEGMAKYYQKDNIKLLGIASWECGMFRDELEEYQNNPVYDSEKVYFKIYIYIKIN